VHGLPAVPRHVGANALEEGAFDMQVLDTDHLVEVVNE
jgi:hypothetical protein